MNRDLAMRDKCTNRASSGVDQISYTVHHLLSSSTEVLETLKGIIACSLGLQVGAVIVCHFVSQLRCCTNPRDSFAYVCMRTYVRMCTAYMAEPDKLQQFCN